MNRRILIVEDDQVVRTELAHFLRNRKYTVVLAVDGKDALEKMRSSKRKFGSIVLDLRMPNMTGEELLRVIQEECISVPPIIVLSAYFDREAVAVCLRSGVKCLFKKQVHPDSIERALDAIVRNDDSSLLALAGDPESEIRAVTFPSTVLFKLTPDLQEIVEAEDPVGSMVNKREAALRRIFEDRANHRLVSRAETKEGLFIIARRWNSWYPSFFDVPGGCYAVTGPFQDTEGTSCAVVDPGFKCLSVLSEIGVSIHDIDTCVISHNHPDHVAGIFEVMASRHALGLTTKGWCNRTTKEMFGDCSGFGLEMDELNPKIDSPLLSYSSAQGEKRKVLVTGFPTAHREIGRSSASLGLILSCCIEDPKGDRLLGKGVILGDTEYNRANHESFIDLLTDEGVRFVVLHIGSAQEKQREGGHLYYPGLKRILADMEARLEKKRRISGKLPVLLSEWGLEHATASQIENICGNEVLGFDDRSPMLETTERLNRDLRMIQVIPADIGLTIGLETGFIHLPDGKVVRAEEVVAVMTPTGIEYKLQ